MAVVARPKVRRGSSYSQAMYYVHGSSALAPAAARSYDAARKPTVAPSRSTAFSLRRQMPLVLALAAVLFIFGFVLLIQISNCSQAAKEVGTLRMELAEIQKQNEVLQKDISAMESASRIQAYATNDLGMTVPAQEDIITVRLPNPRPPTDTLVETPPKTTGWLNTLLGYLD